MDSITTKSFHQGIERFGYARVLVEMNANKGLRPQTEAEIKAKTAGRTNEVDKDGFVNVKEKKNVNNDGNIEVDKDGFVNVKAQKNVNNGGNIGRKMSAKIKYQRVNKEKPAEVQDKGNDQGRKLGKNVATNDDTGGSSSHIKENHKAKDNGEGTSRMWNIMQEDVFDDYSSIAKFLTSNEVMRSGISYGSLILSGVQEDAKFVRMGLKYHEGNGCSLHRMMSTVKECPLLIWIFRNFKIMSKTLKWKTSIRFLAVSSITQSIQDANELFINKVNQDEAELM
ncbi:hypothetical protein Tco_0768652 [Tanacetum coccineum]